MEQKINILEICNGLGIGGTEKTMQIFCKYLDKNKYNVFACGLFKGGERKEIIQKYVSDMLVAHGEVQQIKDFVIKNNIHIVHWHSITQNAGEEYEKSLELLEFFKSRNIRIIETSPFSLYNERIDDLLDMKLFVSKTNLLKYFWKFGNRLKDKSKYSFLYNPLDVDELEKFRLNQDQKNELRKQYGLDEKDFVIGKVGRANLWKWDDTIINIVPKLVKSIPNLKVIIRAIPEIKQKKIIKMGIEKYFIFLPESVSEKDITDTYQVMDVMVHTSRIGECNSVAINEGLFFGLPIVTTSTDFLEFTLFGRDNGQVEIIEDNSNGLVSNKNFEIIEYLIKLYSDKNKLKIVKNNNLNKSINLFSVKNITLKLEDFFENKNIEKFNFNVELESYKKKRKTTNIVSLLQINIQAIIDKFINKA